MLEQHDWPGNVRELAHTLERAYLVGGGRITAEVLAAEIERHCRRRDAAAAPDGGDFQATMDQTERELLLERPAHRPAATRRPPPPPWA